MSAACCLKIYLVPINATLSLLETFFGSRLTLQSCYEIFVQSKFRTNCGNSKSPCFFTGYLARLVSVLLVKKPYQRLRWSCEQRIWFIIWTALHVVAVITDFVLETSTFFTIRKYFVRHTGLLCDQCSLITGIIS